MEVVVKKGLKITSVARQQTEGLLEHRRAKDVCACGVEVLQKCSPLWPSVGCRCSKGSLSRRLVGASAEHPRTVSECVWRGPGVADVSLVTSLQSRRGAFARSRAQAQAGADFLAGAPSARSSADFVEGAL